ncbi:MAG: DUF5658 family protein [Planctomycetota bacterium]
MHKLVSSAMVTVLAFVVLSSSVSVAQEIGDSGEFLQLPVTAEDGLLFHNGEYIPAPYFVEFKGSDVTVNGRLLKLKNEREREDEVRRDVGGNGRGRGQRNGRGGPGRGGPRDLPPRQRAMFDAGSRRRELVPSDATIAPETAERDARRIAAGLKRGEHVVVFDGTPLKILQSPADRFFLADAFLSSELTEVQRREFVGLGPVGSRDKWDAWVDEFTPTPSLQTVLEEDRDSFLATERRERATIAARHRLESAAYPLTIAAMVLGVIAFGHMLQWVAQGFVIKGDESIVLGASFSSKALLLMLAMSAIDLTWTILALQAGAMSEVNPMASQFASSPLQLTLFKIIATGGALGILYAWRLQPKVQKATWWMCLVCILLTFRWVVFDSMMQ